MRLTELNPRWLGNGGEDVTITATGEAVPRREGVALMFNCPCGKGEHVCLPLDNPVDGGPRVEGFHAYWHREGTTFEELKLTPSIQRNDICRWHGFIGKDIPGEVTVA